MKLMTAQEFSDDIGEAKRAADKEPVMITDRGKPVYVLMKHADYQRMTGSKANIVDLLRQDEPGADFEFDPPRLQEVVRRDIALD